MRPGHEVSTKEEPLNVRLRPATVNNTVLRFSGDCSELDVGIFTSFIK